METSEWTPTRFGGVRRNTPYAGSLEDAAPREATQEAEAIARVGVEGAVESGGARIGRSSDKRESGVRISARVPTSSAVVPQTARMGKVRRLWMHTEKVRPSPERERGLPTSTQTAPARFIFKWRESLGLPTCPYVIRWRIETPWGSVRLHHWLAPDDDRAKHDHPWNFLTFVLWGGYTDDSPTSQDHLRAPAIRYRAATHQHTVFPDPGGAWTIIVTGPKIRNWGFWVKGKFVKMNKYFFKFGHHPCDTGDKP